MTTAPTPIPTPPGFPVLWEDPTDPYLMWERDPMHFPDVLKPLEMAAATRSLSRGFEAAMRTYHAPLEAMIARGFNGWLYMAAKPYMASPEKLAERAVKAEQVVRETIARLGDLWEQEMLPEIKTAIARWEAFDLADAAREEFVAHLDETWETSGRIWELHFELVLPAYLAMSEFDELYRGLFEDAGPLDSYQLLEGFSNMTVEVGEALFALSRRARADETVRTALVEGPAELAVSALSESEAGRAFLAELREYLLHYGRRSDKWSIGATSWVEDPTPAITNLREYVAQADEDGPAAKVARAAQAREAAIADARERIAAYPAPIREQFEGMLAAAQVGVVLSEDHNFWIDNVSTYHVRQVMIEAGRRLVADGAIGAVDDVLMLEPEEVRAALLDGEADLHGLVVARNEMLARQAALEVPPVIGSLPPGPPPVDPMSRSMMKFFGTPPEAPEHADEIRGAAGSRGIARGRARVITSITEAERIAPGDILVAQTTAPPWTPLFATVAAVVTDTGGALSHAAVVAREYGVPAVVGAANASKVIADGQMIEVDGDAGIVRIV